MEVGLVGRGGHERAGIEVGVAGLGALRVRVALDREDEGRTRGLLRGEASLGALGVIAGARLAIIQAVEVFRVRRQAIDDDLRGLARGQRGHRRLAGILALRRADLEEGLHRGRRQEAGRDGLVGRATEDQRKLRVFREGFREDVLTLKDRATGLGRVIAPALAAFAAALPLLLLGRDGRQERPAERRGHQAEELAAHHLAEGRLIERVGFSGRGVFGEGHEVRL